MLKSLISAPTTTTELSQQLRLAPAAVSAHLSRLKAAGLVEPHRSGRRVYYRLELLWRVASGGVRRDRLKVIGAAAPYNTEDEVETFVEILEEILREN